MVQTLAAAGELRRELTYDGLRAAEAKGSKGGRRPAVAAGKTAYLEGRSIAALTREHGVSRGAIRTVVADLMPEHTAVGREDIPVPELPITLDMRGKVADFLRAAELEPAERSALDHGVAVRRGQGYTLCVRPAGSTKTASAPSPQPGRDRSQRQRLYRCTSPCRSRTGERRFLRRVDGQASRKPGRGHHGVGPGNYRPLDELVGLVEHAVLRVDPVTGRCRAPLPGRSRTAPAR
ncbi:hypothetical protein [Streptomyces malaysiensis]